MLFYRYIFPVIICLLACTCPGQDNSDIANWIKENLSAPSDIELVKLSQVSETLRGLDSVDRCEIFKILDSYDLVSKQRFHFKYLSIKASFSISKFACPDLGNGLEMAREALRLAYELEDPSLIIFGNRKLSSQYSILNNHGLAVMHLRIALEGQDALGHDHSSSFVMDHQYLGMELYHTRQYKESIEAFQQALHYNAKLGVLKDDEDGNTNSLFLYNTLGLAYQKTGLYDSAFFAFNKALEFAHKTNAVEWVGLIKGNIGDIYYRQGNYDAARVNLEEDLTTSLAAGKIWIDNAANSMQWLARIDAKHGETSKALDRLYEADRILKEQYNPGYQANIYYAFIEVFKQLQNADSMYTYMQKYQVLHDSLEQKASDDRAEIVQVRLDNQEAINKIMTLNKEKKHIALVRNFVIVLTILGTVIALLYLNRQRLKIMLKQQQMLDAKYKAEAETKDAQQQLTIFTQHLIEKNALVEKLQEQLSQKALDDEQLQAISELSHHSILTEDDWNRFKSLFEKVYPGFFHQLKTHTLDITVAEQRMAAIVKLHISPKEASHLLGISPASVNKTRQRLRTRLGLENDSDLESYFA